MNPELEILINKSIVNRFREYPLVGYCPLTNLSEQSASNIKADNAKTILIDTRTGYFNATQLCITFRDDENTNIDKYLSSKHFIALSDRIEEFINQKAIATNYHESKPNIDNAYGRMLAKYTISKNKSDHLHIWGTYLHPFFFSHIIPYINFALGFHLSQLSLALLLNEAHDETINLSSIISEQVQSGILLQQHWNEQVQLYAKAESTHEVITSDDKTFDWEQTRKLLSVSNIDIQGNITYAVLVVAHYDHDMFPYKGINYKLTMHIVPEDKLEKYVRKYTVRKTFPQQFNDTSFDFGELDTVSNVIDKHIGLTCLPDNILEDFYSAYCDDIDISLEGTPDDRYLTTGDWKTVRVSIVSYMNQFKRNMY